MLSSGAEAGPDHRGMISKPEEDMFPLSALQGRPAQVVAHAVDTRRPVFLSLDGRAVAVLQSLADYEAGVEERAFMRAVVAGLLDLEAGQALSLADAKARLGLR